MKSTRRIRFAFLAAAVACATVAVGQKAVRKAPTAEDWTALAKLPDFTGVCRQDSAAEACVPAVADLPRLRDLLRRERRLPVAQVRLQQAEREVEAVRAGRVLLSHQSMPPRLKQRKRPAPRRHSPRPTVYPPVCPGSWANHIRWSSC
jgi:hypothetical protein